MIDPHSLMASLEVVIKAFDIEFLSNLELFHSKPFIAFHTLDSLPSLTQFILAN